MARYAKFFSVGGGGGGGTNNLQLPVGTVLDTTLRQVQDGLGTGSPLYLSTGSVRIGSTAASAMYWDDTNNRLGIGTNAPTNTFEIASTSASPFKVATTASYFRATFQNSGASGILDFNSSNFQFPTNNVDFGTSTALGARVGIKGSGSTSATTSLLVQNSAGSTALTIKDNQSVFIGGYTLETGNSVTDQLAWKLYTQGGTQYASYIGATNNGGTGDTSLALFGLGTGGGYHGGIRMFTSSNSVSPVLAMIVDRNQSVGIGLVNSTDLTVNASAKLQVDSTTKGFLPPRMTTTQKNAIATPAAGLVVYDSTMNATCEYNGTAWRVVSAGAQSVAASTATTTVDMSAGNVQNITLTASTTLTLSSAAVGTYIMKLIQGGSGSYTVTWPGTVIWSGGTAPTLTTTVGKLDIITLVFDGTNYYGNYSLNY